MFAKAYDTQLEKPSALSLIGATVAVFTTDDVPKTLAVRLLTVLKFFALKYSAPTRRPAVFTPNAASKRVAVLLGKSWLVAVICPRWPLKKPAPIVSQSVGFTPTRASKSTSLVRVGFLYPPPLTTAAE